MLYFSYTEDVVLDHFKDYKAFLENHTMFRIKTLHNDRGSEYTNATVKYFCTANGIIMQLTTPYSPAQNGITECLNQTLLEHARAILFVKQLLWAEAIAYACYIKNRGLTKALG